jgi:DNA polymerase-3 subunit chi
MRVDFYQLSRDPVEQALPLIARAAKGAGQRLLVVSQDAAQLDRIDEGLWRRLPEAFLAHGRAGQPHADRQPVLLSQDCRADNGARFIALADGLWREEAADFERAFLMFGEAHLQAARDCWRMLGQREGVERHYWKQEGGKWVKGA